MSPSGLDTRLLDQDAVRAIVRLQSFGHEAYLVGGCVRDLLLGHRPKDFDIATSARPPAVKRTFPRNSRIIGRRFKLAHLHFDGNRKILEVSTFRRPPEQGEDDGDDEDLLITRDNEFGTAEQDAVRRDFTINALFLDPNRDELIDHVGGLDDIERGMLRTIGDPFVRFREDPVRILRAIKFAGRLGLSIEERTATAMRDVAPDLVRAAPPRVLEEILRLLRGGHAFDAIERMRDCGALRAILPVVDGFLDSASRDDRLMFWRTLEALDGRARRAARN
ncbi:MAG: poly(A) polymerase, partial [Planctomycetes bacterium]|nr:poly(A) polymerase [Planctomycetota bacterium]